MAQLKSYYGGGNHPRKTCLTLLGPAAAKRQPSGAPATRSVAPRLTTWDNVGHNAGHNVRQRETKKNATQPNISEPRDDSQSISRPKENLKKKLPPLYIDQMKCGIRPDLIRP